jgi:hypothetical protein
MEDVLFKEPDSLVYGAASGSTTKQLFLERKPRIRDKSLSLMSAAGVTDEASEEVEIIAKLHSLIVVDPSEPEEELSRPTHGDANPLHSSPASPPISQPERRNLRVDTRLSHVLCPPPQVVVESGNRLSTTTTASASASEPDVEETGTRRAIRSMTSLPSFHLPHRTRSISYREVISDTPSLTSASVSSLTSGSSPMSLNSGLCTPPHSPSGHALVHTELTTPSTSHLSPISELQSTEDHIERLFPQPKEGNSTQTVTRPGSSSAVRGSSESDGQGQGQGQAIVAPLDVPGAPHVVYTHMYHSDSPTSTVIGLGLQSSSSTPMSTSKQLPTPPSVSPSPPPPPPSSSLLSLPSTTGRAWPFGASIHNRASARTNAVLSRGNSNSGKADKAEKAEEKKRKKAEARAQNEKLALELKRKQKAGADQASVYSSGSSERMLSTSPRAWEEDIAIYGSLASM